VTYDGVDEKLGASRANEIANGILSLKSKDACERRYGPGAARRKCPSKKIDRWLDSGNLHVLKAEGDYSRHTKLHEEIVTAR
jgi:hypothetical protein